MLFVPGHPDQFLWFSLRDGYKHLYLYNTDGELIKQVTKGNYEVEGIIGFDAKSENLFVYANKDNPTGCAAYRVNLNTLEMTPITPTEGTHHVVVSADGTMVIDSYSAVNVPGRCNVSKFKGTKQVTEKNLYELDNPLADYAMPRIDMGSIKAADGVTDLYYRLITPPNMEAGKKYPTLVYVYGGPHSQLVTDSWLGGGNLYFLYLAQQGYVVFTLDNRGTDNRGFEFESCTHRQLGTIEMADQLEGVKFLQSLPYVDKDRMGVEGWSFGGFMTITMKLAHPEIFKVGCAGGPVIDWKWYEIMYGERYMDTPQENPEGYAGNSLLNKAKDLEGRLLVIHGAEDNTVVWQNSIEFIDACIKAGKQVDYFVYPHHEHNVRGYDRLHLYEKMFDYYETFLK
jgi:dipeptidyl-peptidase-4